jgi:septum formation protein
MLSNAGLDVVVDPADVDEAAIKDACRGRGESAEAAAAALARAKAEKVSGRRPGCLVIGADQLLECEGRWFDKPADRAAAAVALGLLRGRSHRLLSAAVVACDGIVRWAAVDTATLVMRPFGNGFLERYLDAQGDSVTWTVGGYRLESIGVQLFDRVEGDFFTILGMPLLPLLGFLRDAGRLET